MKKMDLISSLSISLGCIFTWIQPIHDDVKIYFTSQLYGTLLLLSGIISLFISAYNLRRTKRLLIPNVTMGLLCICILSLHYYPILKYGKIARIPVTDLMIQQILFDFGQVLLIIGSVSLFISGIAGMVINNKMRRLAKHNNGN